MNLAVSKKQFADDMQSTARLVLQVKDRIRRLNAAYSTHGFQTGGSNAFVDSDFTATNTHLTAALVAAVMFAIGGIDGNIDTGKENALLSGLPGGLP